MTTHRKRERLPPGQHLVAPGKWPTIGEKLPAESDRPWTLTLCGNVHSPTTFTLPQLKELSQHEITTDIHCVTRWSRYDVRFRGVLLGDLLQTCGVQDSARFVSFVARSERRHASSLPLKDAIDLQTMIVTHAEGVPLPIEKGGPIRSLVPGRYFYKSVKWVEQIELLEQDRLGFWESDSGYHNVADPWQEQRFISQSVDKREAKRLIESKDFSNRDLLSIVVKDHDLNGLVARSALLRNADFSGCRLESADFSGANLSNANFANARLEKAIFRDTDLEGADFSGANLSGATFENCSLFGSTFFESIDSDSGNPRNPAIFSSTTGLSHDQYQVLTPQHYDFVHQKMS